MDVNFGSVLESIADLVTHAHPGRIAIAQGDRTRSWAELDARASALAGWLVASGLKAGDRVGIGLYNSIEYFEALFAIFKMRAVPVNINYRYLEPELEGILTHTDVAAVVVDRSLEGRIASVSRFVQTLKSVVVAGESGDPVPPDVHGVRFVRFEDAVTAPPQARQKRAASDQIILLTGGTTGKPKGVVWDHSGIASVVRSVYARVGLTAPTDQREILRAATEQLAHGTAPVVLPASPLMHGTGFFTTLGNLMLGGQVVCLEGRSFDAAELWRDVARRRVNEIAIVGDAFGMPMLSELDRAAGAGTPYDLTSVQRIVSSGMLWSVDVKKRLLRAGRMTLHESLASTEGGPYGVSVAGPDEESVTSGFTLPPNVRVMAEDGRDIEPGSGESGFLASCGNVPVGYLKDRERTDEVFRWIAGVRYVIPGDAARLESDGSLVLLGRGSAVINTGGEKVFAEEVEEALLRHPAVHEAVVIGVADQRWGTSVAALVLPTAGQHPTVGALAAHVGTILAAYKRPRQIFFVDSIERSIAGKVDRHRAELRADVLVTSMAGMSSDATTIE